MATTVLDTIDLTVPELYRHGFPHDLFGVLREEAPVWWHPPTSGAERVGGGFWVVSRHADVQAVSRDHQRFSSFDGPQLPEMPVDRRGMMIVSMDPPAHTRVRRLISAGFTPRMIAKLDAQARDWAVAIIERALAHGECNFVHEVAYKLPMHMIADIMGIPVADREWLFDRVNELLQSTDPRSRLTQAERAAVEVEMYGYAHDLGAEKRRNPTDDVWTTLTTAEVDTGDGAPTQLTELELDLFFLILTIAGSETTRNAISSGLIALIKHPGQMARLRNEPELMTNAVEEILRWASPVAYFRRTCTVDTEIRGVPIPAGDRVSVWYPSANRDADVFDDPFAFDITRAENSQVAFGGGGVHYCLGANLAKREIRVMFEELLMRVRDIELLGEPEYAVQGIGNPIVMSLKELPVRLTPA
jgi:cholest-4-en-3-one 26-monooxygenase